MPKWRILRRVVPVDDQWHLIGLSGPIVHVAARQEGAVEIWFMHDPAQDHSVSALRVFGTGQTIDDGSEYVGTAITPSARFVWHLMRRAI